MAESTRSRRSPGEGAVYKIADGTWRATVYLTHPITGLRSRRVVRGRTRRAALDRLAAIRPDDPTDVTLGLYLEGWLEGVRPQVRPATFREYHRHLVTYIVPVIGRAPLARLQPAQVEAVTSAMLARGLAPATARHTRIVLRHALADAMRDGLLLRNVAALAHPPRMVRPEMRTLDAAEVRRFLAATAGDRFGPLYALALATGLRQGELLGLAWADLDVAAGTLTVRRALARAADGRSFELAEPKTRRSRRTLALPTRAIDALTIERARQAARRAAAGTAWQDVAGLIFTDTIGRHVSPSEVSHDFREGADRLGFAGVRFHDLRHTAATLALAAGVGLKTVSEMLGHSTITVTADTYAHVTPAMRREVADAMDRVLG